VGVLRLKVKRCLTLSIKVKRDKKNKPLREQGLAKELKVCDFGVIRYG